MKKRLLALLLATLILTAVLCSCSASSKSYDMAQSTEAEAPAASEMASEMGEAYNGEAGDGVTSGETQKTVDLSEKIIYSMDATIETLDFDGSIDMVTQLLDRFGGFVETSSVSGVNYASRYNGYTVNRYASYTLRVPVENYRGMTDSLSEIGNVVSQSSYADNITAQFYDSQSRLDTYRTEEERLLAMLDKADDVESMIAIEQRLSDVRYQIESLETKLTNWQNEVDYSTVTIYIEEVAQLTEEKPVVRSYWQQVGDGISESLIGIAEFFKDFLKFFLAALPVLLVLGVIAIIVILIIRKAAKKRRAKKAAPPASEQNIEKK